MKNILIIGCGLLGSSLLRVIKKKQISKKIFIYEKSKVNVLKIKKLKLPGIIINKLDQRISNVDLIIVCTPMSEYKNLILKLNNFLSSKTIITDVGSSKSESLKIVKKFLTGKKKVLAKLPWGSLGLTICYDVRFPSSLYRFGKRTS